MANNGCFCGETVNTGLGKCPSIIRRAVGFDFVRMYADDGTENTIDLNTVSNPINYDVYSKNVDGSKRHYPLRNLKNVVPSKTDATKFDFDDQSSEDVQDGVYNWEFQIAGNGVPHGLIGGLDAIKCGEYGVYLVDESGAYVGTNVDADGIMRPIPITSYNPDYMFAATERLSYISVMFQLEKTFKAETLWKLDASQFTSSLLRAKGVVNASIEVDSVVINTGNSDVTVVITDNFNGNRGGQNVAGLDAVTDFTFVDAAGATVVINSVVESASNYVINVDTDVLGDYTLATVIAETNFEGEATVTLV